MHIQSLVWFVPPAVGICSANGVGIVRSCAQAMEFSPNGDFCLLTSYISHLFSLCLYL